MNTPNLVLPLLLLWVVSIPLSVGAQWSNGRKANTVLGQPNFTANAYGTGRSQMDAPHDMAVDRATGKLFVSDSSNSRVLRYSSAAARRIGAIPEAVFGQPDFNSTDPGISATRMDNPSGLFVDVEGRLWVCDSFNNRVLRFDNASLRQSGTAADGVLGQPTFSSGTNDLTAAKMYRPQGLAIDFYGNLWVADQFNSRVLKFEDAKNKANGAPADVVLGQANFTSNVQATSASGMDNPLDVDTRTVRYAQTMPPAIIITVELWVADRLNNRVLRFSSAETLSSGASADLVLGQTLFTTKNASVSQAAMRDTWGVKTDKEALWVSDRGNDRVLRFENLDSISSGASASIVLGQANFFGESEGVGQARLSSPVGLEVDEEGNLWIADDGNNRVLRFSPGAPRPDHTVGRNGKNQKGNNIYNLNAAGQKLTHRSKGRKKAQLSFLLQNDGPYDDAVKSRASRGSRAIDIAYYDRTRRRKNATAQLVTGRYRHLVLYASPSRFDARIQFNGRGKRNISFLSRSLENGAADKVKAKVVGKP